MQAWIALALVAAAPSAQAEALGLRLAETGTLASLLPLITAKETEEMAAAHPELSEAETAALRTTAAEVARAGSAKVMAAMGKSYAERLSVAELETLVAFNEGAAAARYRAVQPAVIAATMQTMAGLDFKRDVMAAFCAKTGKGCAAQAE